MNFYIMTKQVCILFCTLHYLINLVFVLLSENKVNNTDFYFEGFYLYAFFLPNKTLTVLCCVSLIKGNVLFQMYKR